ncbi:MAG: class I SAM-dependent rRNA methyltransferase [Acidobacteriota bacterium]|nr:class I SAM-dependent rRNA methyltransferase [Acidobacteriota bacterium]
MSQPTVTLKGKRATIMARYQHPWVFSMGIENKPRLAPGTLTRVVDPDKKPLGWGFYHPKGAIALRMISFSEEEPGPDFWQARIAGAFQMRRNLLGPDRHNYRLLNGEHDGFPGLTADVYGDLICIQVSTAGMDLLKPELAAMLVQQTGATAVYERSEGPAREQEGLKPTRGFLYGSRELPVTIQERGFQWTMDPEEGHKTGFYLDQHDQHAWVEARAAGKEVLDLCCYVGGFTLAALRGGADHVRSVDVSPRAVAALADHLARNGLHDGRQETVKADVFTWLKQKPDRQFDMVILDPPALAKSIKTAKNALKAYSRLQTHAARWVKPGGILFTFSCSGVVTLSEFQQSCFLGLRLAEREPMLIHRCGPGPDHPVNLRFPEGEYLKGLAVYLP